MYNIFVSHSWSYGDQYERLINLLEAKRSRTFDFRNYSVPKDNPIHDAPNSKMLKVAIKRQMSPASVVLILAGVYSTYSTWINYEIDIAKNGFINKKPIIAIEPWGSERTSSVVKGAAEIVVKWNSSAIITAIQTLSR